MAFQSLLLSTVKMDGPTIKALQGHGGGKGKGKGKGKGSKEGDGDAMDDSSRSGKRGRKGLITFPGAASDANASMLATLPS